MKDIEIKATEDEKVTEKSWSVILSLFLHLEILRGGSGIPSKHMFHDADVRINIQRVSLIELVQLMLEALHDRIHGGFDTLLGLPEVLSFHAGRFKGRVRIQELLCCR